MLHPGLDEFLSRALREDAPSGDATTAALGIAGRGSGYFLAKEDMVVCGLEVAMRVFGLADPRAKFSVKSSEGSSARKGAKLATVDGDLAAMLLAERTALNIFQRMSGIATMTRRAVKALGNPRARLLDTRKTTPLMRSLEKYAVRTGGGHNHRMGLSDAILIKDNHIEAVGGVFEAVSLARKNCPMKKVEVEVKDLSEYREALEAGADIILLDNMSDGAMLKAVSLRPGGVLLEVSGGVTMERLPALGRLGVDLVSMGALTHSVRSCDISFEIERKK